MEKRASKNTSRKPIRKSQTRRASQGRLSEAEARREIAHALLLHRASSSSPPSPPPPPPPPPNPWGDCWVPTIAPGWCNFGLGSVTCSWTSHQLSSSMVEVLEPLPLPLLEPTWSTSTAPASKHPPTSPPPIMEVPEFQCLGEDNQDSSYTWWLGFLKALDDEIINNNEESVSLPSDEEIEMEYFRQLFTSLFKTHHSNQIDPSLDNQILVPDEWLTVPEVENHRDVSDC
ncbi:uncharacterized protein LOC122085377 [Macadamia integrifolia]|uniref:uncharacterized protein LOC122085377 n=1 Tax=Macadamia integrifolia TaxID=60698 RepID=UPI001C4E374C|nr:uncharacterized protein LOC122085377 [Macadamia integrifolia]